MGAELFHADVRTDMTKLIVAFRLKTIVCVTQINWLVLLKEVIGICHDNYVKRTNKLYYRTKIVFI